MARLRAASKFPVTILLAAAGFGKSTAMRQFLEERANVVFIQTPHTATLSKFIVEFSRVCSVHFPLMAPPPDELPNLSEDASSSVDLYVSWALTHLVNAKCTIAIDDLQFAGEDPAVGTFVTRVVEGTKSTIKWVLATRTRGTLPLARWQAYGDSDAPILAEELRITAEEAEQLASSLGSPATSGQLKQWLRETNGFPVPLAYAIRLSARRGTVENIIDGTRALTFEFLAEHLWTSLSPADRELLEIAALLPSIHMHHYESAGIEASSRRISRLSADVAFLNLSANGHFSMHDLFREFVVQMIDLSGPEVLRQRRSDAIRVLLLAKRFNEAIRLAIERGNAENLAALVEQCAENVTDHVLIRDLIDACQGLTSERFGLQMLCVQAEYWGWTGDLSRAQTFASEILKHRDAQPNQLLLAIRTSFRSIDTKPEDAQREWLDTIACHSGRLSDNAKVQVDAFRASILARYPETRNEAKNLIKRNMSKFQQLEAAERLSAEMATANACYWLDDLGSTLYFSREAVRTSAECGDLRQQARTLNNLGIILLNNYDAEVATLFEPLKLAVENTGAWRFSHVSHWFPSYYFALQADSAKAESLRKLQHLVHPLEEYQRGFLRTVCRHSDNLGYILAEEYDKIIRNSEMGSITNEGHLQYILGMDEVVAYTMMSKVKAARSLNLARSIRGELSSHDRNRIQEGVLMEVICLGANGQWLQARRLCEQGIGSSPGLAAAKEMLRRFCDGPPFVGLREALAPCVGRPFVGLAALLVARVVDRLGVPDATGSLTAAELDVLRLLSLGKSNKAIADARSRSTETVKRQVAAIYKKLGVENRTSALAAAKELGIV
jgi:DNA-binding CsgD family transcriptional regulator